MTRYLHSASAMCFVALRYDIEKYIVNQVLQQGHPTRKF